MLVERTVIVEDVDRLELVLLAEHIVIDVVGRGDLEASCTELYIYILVLDHGDSTPYEGDDEALASEEVIALILGVDTHSGIPHDGLGAGRSHDDVAILSLDVVAQVIELTLLLLIDDFFVTEGCAGLGVPVHHTHTTIDQPLAIELYEDVNDALATLLVHGEGRTLPVAGGT